MHIFLDFSYLYFDINNVYRNSGIKWEHEDASVMLFENLIETNNIELLEQEDIRFISRLIKGDLPTENNEKSMLNYNSMLIRMDV